MNKILAISVLLGVTVMMMGSILPVMAVEVPEACPVTDPTCGKGGGNNEKHPSDCISGVAKAGEESGKKIPVECPKTKVK
jgi:hypothetical protein